MLTIRELLNQIKWDPKYSSQKTHVMIQYTHRGVPKDYLIIAFENLLEIHSDSFEYWNSAIQERIRIPFHRIEKIFNEQTNQILYIKRVTGASTNGKESF